MEQSCRRCQSTFEISDDDLAFYEKVSPVFNGKTETIPPPTLCPECRQQRRLVHSNESKLYHRASDLSGKQMISAYSPDKKHLTVYDAKEWWSDAWDARTYARDIDWNRSFLQQFYELTKEVPLMSLLVDGNENSDYGNQSGWNKNCYLCFCVEYSEDSYYCHDTYHSKNAIDCYFGYNLEVCYECIGCRQCYSLFYSQNCTSCSDSWYLFDCIGCKHCFGSAGLRQKEYCFFNEQLTKEEYEERLADFLLKGTSERAPFAARAEEIFLKHPRNAMIGAQNENSVGNYLYNCKNASWCFDSVDLQDCRFCTNIRNAKDCQDFNRWGHFSELCYECVNVGADSSRILFSNLCWTGSSDLLYCFCCMSCMNCFGCDALKKANYCILNKQYTKEEYEELVPKIIAKMRADGEWGEFFDPTSSFFAYNETVAQERFPLNKEEVLARGWTWQEDSESSPSGTSSNVVPAHIDDVSNDIVGKVISCEKTGKPYKITPQELRFYKENNISLPRLCPEARRLERIAKRNPRKLWHRECGNCHKPIVTSYGPDRPEIVYCEDCYLKEVY
jgi:hypothetical protein